MKFLFDAVSRENILESAWNKDLAYKENLAKRNDWKHIPIPCGFWNNTSAEFGSFHGARYLTNFLSIDLEAAMGTYELRSYDGEK